MDINLINDDCMKVLPELPNESIDMILCDLPYGATQNPNDIPLPLNKLWVEYKRIIKSNGCIALFAQGGFYVDLVNSNRKMFRYDLIWDKVLTTGFLNAHRMPLRQHEQIAIFYKKLPKYNPQMTIGAPLHSRGKKYITHEATNNNYGKFNQAKDLRKGSTQKYPTSILRFEKPHPGVTLHPTQKPVELLKWLIKTYTDECETVLDNCMGCGSCGVATVETKRRFIGIEKDKKWFDIAKRLIYKQGGSIDE